MFPHIFKVVLAAQTCHTLQFESYTNIWLRNPKNLFKCPANGLQEEVTFYGTLL